MLRSEKLPSYLKVEPLIDLDNQSFELPNEPGVRVSQLLSADKKLTTWLFDDCRPTLFESFRRGARVSNNGPCLGYREQQFDGSEPYVWLTYNDVIEKSRNLARFFLRKNVAPGQQTLIGIYSLNRPEWIITEQACYEYSMIVVPLYDTLGHDGVTFIIKQTTLQLIVVDKASRVEGILKKHADYSHLRVIVMIDEFEESLKEKAKNHGVELISFQQALILGTSFEVAPRAMPPLPEHLSTICYTSGTTGFPKGAMLTHASIIANCSGMTICKYIFPSSDDIVISYLPLAHMFERVLATTFLTTGARIGFYRGDIRLLAEDMQELRPTFMAAVPRLLNRIYDKTMAEINSNFLKRWVFKYALWSKTIGLNNGIIRTDSWWDYFVFNKIRNKLGGCLKFVITGSAPCSSEVLTFIRASLGCVVLEGYGQTECVVCASGTMVGDHNSGHVGPPLPCCKIKLVDVPELNCYAKDKGEVCIAGPIIFKGYYKDEAKTAEVLDEDGWLHTGDIGQWTEQGTLKLIDRKKHIFKLSQGEYISPEKIENIYNCSKYVQQSFVYGESLKTYLVAIVVPDAEIVVPEVKRLFNLTGDLDALCQNDDVRRLVLDDMSRAAREAGLNSFEMVKAIYLSSEPFSIENGLLTPTFKSKRRSLKERYAQQLSYMYAHAANSNRV